MHVIIPPNHTDPHMVWTLPQGEVRWDPTTGRLSRHGLDSPMRLPPGELSLRPMLGDAHVMAQLGEPRVMPPGAELLLRLSWPILIQIWHNEHVVDRFRPRMTWTLLGAVGSGRVMPAAKAPSLMNDVVPPWECALQVRLRNEGSGTTTLRRFAFPEDGLSLIQTPGGLVAGDVRVTIRDHDQATAVCERPEVGPDCTVIRPGDPKVDGTLRPVGLEWWLDSTRRSMGFSL